MQLTPPSHAAPKGGENEESTNEDQDRDEKMTDSLQDCDGATQMGNLHAASSPSLQVRPPAERGHRFGRPGESYPLVADK